MCVQVYMLCTVFGSKLCMFLLFLLQYFWLKMCESIVLLMFDYISLSTIFHFSSLFHCWPLIRFSFIINLFIAVAPQNEKKTEKKLCGTNSTGENNSFRSVWLAGGCENMCNVCADGLVPLFDSICFFRKRQIKIDQKDSQLNSKIAKKEIIK